MKSNLPIDEALYEQGYNQAIKDLDDCDWQAFRREAAKDILTVLIEKANDVYELESLDKNIWCQQAIEWADELIKQLKQE